MIASDLLLDIYRVYRGKIDSRAPVWGSDKANVAIDIANRKVSEWATDPRNKWNSLFETSAPTEPGTVTTAGTTTLTGSGTYFTDYEVGDTILVSGETVRTIDTIVSNTSLTVTAAFSTSVASLTFYRSIIVDTANLTYNLPRTLFSSSDYAKVVKTDSSYVEYSIVKAQQRNVPSGQATYVHGLNPKKLTFAQDIDTGLDAGTLYVPGYYIPSDITASTDIVPVDDPVWLVYSTAAELARNDPAKDDQYAVLTGMANELYLRMSNANNDTGLLQLNTVINGMPMIGDSTESWSQ